MAELNTEFCYQVLAVVEEIPIGKVATYGQIARLIGFERNSRLVAKVLGGSSVYGDFPCHRVVNANGRLAPGWDEQKSLLLAEGVTFRANGNVDLQKCQMAD